MTDLTYGDEVARTLDNTDDAMVWAVEWCKVARTITAGTGQVRGVETLIDEGWMVGWFANAIEIAKRIDRDRHPERKPVQDVDYVLLPRQALQEFFGRMALPPWQDVDGRWIGGNIDCAPIASEISEWIEANDLGDLYRRSGT